MKRYQRLTAAVLLFLLGGVLLTACSPKGEQTGKTAIPVPVSLRVILPKVTANYDDAGLVTEEINRYISGKIGVQVEIVYADNYSQAASQLLSSDEQADILYCGGYSRLSEWQAQGWLYPLDDLLTAYGGGITEAIPEEYRLLGQIGDAVYGLPTNRDMAGNVGLEYRADIAKQYGIDLSHVKTVDDLTGVFQQVKDKCPDITPVAKISYRTWDSLGNGYGVLMDFGNSRQVVNLYETQEFRSQVLRSREWQQKGYILDETVSSGDNFFYFRSGEVFSSFAYGKPGFTTQETRTIGAEIGFIELYPAFSCTSNLNGYYYVISGKSADPEKAMSFMNLMYSDPVVANLMSYGIEGKHYVFSDGNRDIVTFPEGITAANSGYSMFETWRRCNQFITYPWEGDPPDIWQQMQEFNRTAKRSQAYGFRFDDSRVKSQVLQCNEVCDKYLSGLMSGTLDPETVLPEFQQALRDAGIEDIIREKQTQLDRWWEMSDRPS